MAMSEQQSKSTDKRVWMILEDDYPLRFMLESMFRLWNSEPLSFANGYDASAWLDQIESGTMKGPMPEVALLDIRVPGPQGPEIAERMHRVAQTAHIAVVIMTAYRLDLVEKDKIVAQAQPDGFVNKGSPIFDTLQDVLEEAIRKAKERAAITTAKTITSEAPPKEPVSVDKPASASAPSGSDPSDSDGSKAVKPDAAIITAKPKKEQKPLKKPRVPASSRMKRTKSSSTSKRKPADSKTSKPSPGKTEGR